MMEMNKGSFENRGEIPEPKLSKRRKKGEIFDKVSTRKVPENTTSKSD